MASKKPRGIASLPPEERRRISRMGGIAAHKKGKAHEWNSEEAKKYGKLGGKWSKYDETPRFREEL